jgi:hypothetical protein
MAKLDNLIEKRFGKLLVKERILEYNNNSTGAWWKCICDCGREKIAYGVRLRNGQCSSCGCLSKEVTGNLFRKHGLSTTKEYRMLKDARKRAKRFNLEYNIDITDIVIPENCPILNIPLVHGTKYQTDSSPSLDRIDSSKGYIKGNVRVISVRANRLKQDSTIEELKRIIQYMEGEI